MGCGFFAKPASKENRQAGSRPGAGDAAATVSTTDLFNPAEHRRDHAHNKPESRHCFCVNSLLTGWQNDSTISQLASRLGSSPRIQIRLAAGLLEVVTLLLMVAATASLIPGWTQETSAASANAAEQAASNDAQAPTKNWAAGNPLKIAQLKWYQANLTTSFTVGKTKNSNPYGIAFDGANMWTANAGEGTVSKLRASDGAPLGTFTVGGQPNFLLFDGSNVWVTVSPNTVSKLRASDGKILGSFKVGGAPWWPAFDGENIWVPNFSDGTLSKLRASDGKNLGTFQLYGAIGAAFDGTSVWVTSYGLATVTKLRPSDGKVLGTYGVGKAPLGVAFDGANIWVANNADNSVTKLRASDGKNLGTFVIGGAYGVAFDGTNLWVTAEPGLREVRVSDGALIGFFYGGGGTTGIAFDGANIWVGDALGNTISKF